MKFILNLNSLPENPLSDFPIDAIKQIEYFSEFVKDVENSSGIPVVYLVTPNHPINTIRLSGSTSGNS